MKSKKIIYLEKTLRFMASVVLRKYKPKIVGVTGSIGKTSAKEAIHLVLKSKFSVRTGEKNYNNEIGIPLTIIGARSGGSSVVAWLGVFVKWIFVVVFPVKYPEILILEMGIDRPGDMDYLLGFIPVDVAVLTDISGSHLEFFKTINRIAKEKWKVIENVSEDGAIIVNFDNEKIRELLNKHKKEEVNGITFGFREDSMLRASDVNFHYERNEIYGISFKLNYSGKVIPVRLVNVIAKHHLYAVLAGISVGVYFKINPIDISASLEKYFPPPGRMTLLEGVNGTMIVDDTYNASKTSTIAALNILREVRARRKIAVLGDMLELGDVSHEEHKEVIEKCIEMGLEIFLVGRRMERAAVDIMEEKNASKEDQWRLRLFKDPVLAGKNVFEFIEPGDIVLVKGSQSMRMEKAVEEIVARTVNVGDRLCRQSQEWKSRPYIQP